jgi:hypothetical protein
MSFRMNCLLPDLSILQRYEPRYWPWLSSFEHEIFELTLVIMK